MKKIITITFVALSIVFTSCKENTKKEINKEAKEISKGVEKGLDNLGKNLKDGYNDAKRSVNSAFDDIKIPKLQNEEAQAHLENYANYVKNQLDKGAKNIKNSEFVKETQEFGEKSESILKNLSADAKKSFEVTLSKIDAKVNKIEKDLEK